MKSASNQQILKFIWNYYRRFPWMISASYFFITISFIADLFNPLLMSKTVTIIQDSTQTVDQRFHEALFWVFMIIVQAFVYHVSNRASHFLNASTDSKVEAFIATEAFDRVQRFSTDWHNNSFSGSTVTKIKRGSHAAMIFFDIVCYDLYPALGIIVGLIIITTLKNYFLGLIFSVFAVIYLIVSITLSLYYVVPQRKKANKEDNKVGAALADATSCNATIKTFGGEERELIYFKEIVERWRKVNFKAWIRSNIVATIQNFMILGLKFCLFSGTIWLWSKNILSVADFVFILSTYLLFGGYFRTIGERIRELQEAMSDIEDVVTFQFINVDIKDLHDAKELQVTQGKIECKNILFHYPYQKKEIYKNFSLTISSGEKVAIVGHSGSGKSTFVKLVQRLYNLQEGKILIDGQDIASITQQSLRKNIALVPQDPLLFHRTLRENIAYAKPDSTLEQIDSAAKQAHAFDFIQKFPAQYETLVGERGVKLSGGERQRVAIARAIIANCPILILDEATSSLDSHSESLIQDALKNLLKQRTAIIIAHRLSTIQSVDRILVFEDGKIIEEGTHFELLKKTHGTYKKLYEMQVGGFLSE